MTAVVLVVFVAVYAGMATGRLPGMAFGRAGIAALAAAFLVVAGAIPPAAALASVDFATLAVLGGLMAVSARLGEAGLYGRVAAGVAGAAGRPRRLLFLTILAAGGLSALLANDVVVFAMAPVLCAGLRVRGLDPRPHLAGLAGAANAGSAATLIGNPQNILIGTAGGLDFWGFVAACEPFALFALLAVHGAVSLAWRRELAAPPSAPAPAMPAVAPGGMAVGVLALAAFVILVGGGADRTAAALGIGALVLLLARPGAQARLLGAIDWKLILLFAGLFIVNGALAGTGLPARALAGLEAAGIDIAGAPFLSGFSVLASNTIGNVPATILLLAQVPDPGPAALRLVALVSTLAGNLLLVGSLANIIVSERAAAAGVRFGFSDHLRAGPAMTLAALLPVFLWLAAGYTLG